jgi:Cu(I)/Ag(I) efflux system membrane fusion protein
MTRLSGVMLLAGGLIAGAAGGLWVARAPAPDANPTAMPGAPSSTAMPGAESAAPPAAERKIVYYRDPSGAPSWSAEPKKDDQGRDYLPVYEDEEVSFDPEKNKKAQAGSGGPRKILYYRNPMGLPDTSPTPKKDWMGMDYIPVYEGEEQDDGKTVKVSLDKIQRSGVRTERAEARVLASAVRGIGTVKFDERRVHVVALRFDGYIEDLFVNATGQSVRAGEPLFRVYSREIQLAQVDLVISAGVQPGTARALGDRSLGARTIEGAMQRMRNLDVPESRIKEVRETGTNPRTIDWPAPATGTIIDKRVINGQQVKAGDELYRIVDLSQVWIIAEVAESELAGIAPGTPATVTLRAYPQQPLEGRVTFIYPEVRMETRTARIRIEVPNPEGRLKVDMYADVVLHPGADDAPVTTVPASAIIDSGTRQVVLIAKDEGRFEPRAVKLGRRSDGYVEVTEGVSDGEQVVTAATFLIDAESNLKAALQAFAQPEPAK